MMKRRGDAQRTAGIQRALARLGIREPREARLRSVVEAYLIKVLAVCDGNRTLAAAVLGVPRASLQRRLHRFAPELLTAVDEGKPAVAAEPEKPEARKTPGPPPRIDGAIVLRLRSKGIQWWKIADRLSCTVGGARLAAKRELSRRPKQKRRYQWIDADRVRTLRSTGKTWAEIGNELGCSPHGARLAAEREVSVTPADRMIAGVAEKIGCSRARARELIASWPATERSKPRRMEVLGMRFGESLTRDEIAKRWNASYSYVGQVETQALQRLSELHKGRGHFSTRLKRRLSDATRTETWTLERDAPKLECWRLLRIHHFGGAALAELHLHLRAANVKMACGCPDIVCAAAERALRKRAAVTQRQPSSPPVE